MSALTQLELHARTTGTNSGGNSLSVFLNEESNRNVALSFEPACVRRDGPVVIWIEESRDALQIMEMSLREFGR